MYHEQQHFGFRGDQRGEIVEGALQKIEIGLAETQINPIDFADLYDRSQIQKDIERTGKLKERQKRERTPQDERNYRLAKAFEGIVLFHGEQSMWFGENAATIHTSEFDDICNKVDGVIEYVEEGSVSRAAMAFDVTYSQNLYGKFADIIDSIDAGKLSKVKYFESEESGMRGEISGIPRLIIGAEPKVVEELAVMWLENRNVELSKHFIQFQMLEMMLMQCEGFARYARSVNKEEIALKYDNLKYIFEKVLEEKKEDLDDNGERDGVFRALEDKLGNIK